MSVDVKGICFDSRKVRPGSLFIAIKGTQSDGHEYIAKAIELGAIAVVCEKLPDPVTDKITIVMMSTTYCLIFI